MCTCVKNVPLTNSDNDWTVRKNIEHVPFIWFLLNSFGPPNTVSIAYNTVLSRCVSAVRWNRNGNLRRRLRVMSQRLYNNSVMIYILTPNRTVLYVTMRRNRFQRSQNKRVENQLSMYIWVTIAEERSTSKNKPIIIYN